MSGIVELLGLIGNENIEFQMLDNSMTNIKQTKRYAKVEFITGAISASDVALNTGKRGIIVWVDCDKLEGAFAEVKCIKDSENDR